MGFLGKFGSALAGAASGNPLGFISGGIGIADSILGLAGQSSDQRFSREQMEWQSLEAQKQRDFQLDMWKMNNEYNKPTEQMKRLSEAGINPWSAMSSSSLASGTSSLSVPSGFGPSPAAPASSALSSLGLAAEVLGKLANAKKAGAETNRIDTLLQTELEKLIAEKNFVSLQSARQAIENSNLPHIMKKQLDKLATEIDLNKVTKDEVNERINEIISRTNLNTQQAALVYKFGERMQESIIAKNNAEANQANENAIDMRETRSSRVAMNYAEANRANEEANDLRLTRQSRIDNLNADTSVKQSLSRINNLDADVRDASKAKEIARNISNYTQDMLQQKILTKTQAQSLVLLQVELEKAAKDADWKTFNQILNSMKDVAITFGSAAVGFNTIKNSVQKPVHVKGFGR